MHGCGVFHAKP